MHALVAPDAGEQKRHGAHVLEHFAVLAQGAVFAVGELAVVAVGVLFRCKQVDDLLGLVGDDRPEDEPVDEGEDRRVDTDGDGESEDGGGGETGGFGEQAEGVTEIV